MFDKTVTVLFWMPLRPLLSNTISTFPSLPGLIGALVKLLAVQPQLVLTLLINRSAVPVFLNLKV